MESELNPPMTDTVNREPRLSARQIKEMTQHPLGSLVKVAPGFEWSGDWERSELEVVGVRWDERRGQADYTVRHDGGQITDDFRPEHLLQIYASASSPSQVEGEAARSALKAAKKEFDRYMPSSVAADSAWKAGSDALIAALSTPLQAGGGYVLVPREPTPEMLNAAIDVDSFKLGDISPLGFRCSPQQLFAECYTAMVANAPALSDKPVESKPTCGTPN